MPATRDGKLWRSQFYYKDWQGVRRKKNKRGFKTKGEADEWERNFLQQQQKNLDISFENFVEIYFADMENRLRESTIINKRYVFDLKVTPYFKHKKMCEIQTSDIRAWQNELIKKGYAPTYLKSINNQLAALFNYAVRYYDLRDNPCRKAGSIGKSKADEMDFSYTTFDLNAVLRSVAVSFFKSFEERKIIPVLSIAEISFPFYGDEKAVTRIFENIISNALSHGKSDYHFSSYDDNENYHFSFQNFTDSINESDIDKIFNRFYTTDLSRSRKTTGLGLTIAKNLTVKMGGSISASLNNNVFEIVVCFPKQKG